jgi:GNAT superfamily N-acetyltransferase
MPRYTDAPIPAARPAAPTHGVFPVITDGTEDGVGLSLTNVVTDPAPDPLVAPTDVADIDPALGRALEELAHRAWPPIRERRLDGWVLRESRGSSRRGNSVWARAPVTDLIAALREVRKFYTEAGLPPTFQITPVSQPSSLRDALDGAGYDDGGATDVCVADTDDLLAALGHGPLTGDGRMTVTLATHPSPTWLEVAGQVLSTFSSQRPGSLSVLSALTAPTCYALLRIDSRPVAVGRAVSERGWMGIYSMATLPAARGHGAARSVLAALTDWATDAGARRAYLQVEETSTEARRLYVNVGFRPAYRYTYRRAPQS